MGHANSKQLLQFAEVGREKEACELIDECYVIDCNYTNQLGETALHLSSANNMPRLVRKLLANGADANRLNKFHSTALMIACRMGYVEIVSLLLHRGRADPNLEGEFGLNALSIGCGCNNINVVRLLLEHHTQVQPQSLLLACMHGDNHEMVRLLLQHGAEVDSRDKYHNTPLMQASLRGHWGLVNVLVSREWTPPIDVHARNIYGWTALHFAYAGLARTMTEAMSDTLDQMGVDTHHHNSNNNTNHNHRSRNGRGTREKRNTVDELRKTAETNSNRVIELLVRKGAKIDVRNEDGLTPAEVTDFLDRSLEEGSEGNGQTNEQESGKRRRKNNSRYQSTKMSDSDRSLLSGLSNIDAVETDDDDNDGSEEAQSDEEEGKIAQTAATRIRAKKSNARGKQLIASPQASKEGGTRKYNTRSARKRKRGA